MVANSKRMGGTAAVEAVNFSSFLCKECRKIFFDRKSRFDVSTLTGYCIYSGKSGCPVNRGLSVYCECVCRYASNRFSAVSNFNRKKRKYCRKIEHIKNECMTTQIEVLICSRMNPSPEFSLRLVAMVTHPLH